VSGVTNTPGERIIIVCQEKGMNGPIILKNNLLRKAEKNAREEIKDIMANVSVRSPPGD